MLNIDLQDNPSVDRLERLVKQLITGDENQLRIDGAANWGKGVEKNLARICEHILNKSMLLLTPRLLLAIDEITQFDHNLLVVTEIEDAEPVDQVAMRRRAEELALEGNKIVTIYRRNYEGVA